ncbi:MAG TPA: hypothetical protein VMW72_04050 [Sedimentisphaerales bacterium]|nr:hypothetical protein [Sedimentisphaerales bacterium]
MAEKEYFPYMRVSESRLMQILAEQDIPKATVLRAEQVSDKEYKSKDTIKRLVRMFDADDNEI